MNHEANQVTSSGGSPELSTATRLAFERTRVAYERTLMAWVRTGTSLITFGFSVYKFFQLEAPGHDFGSSLIGTREFALVLIGIGLISLLLGAIEHRRDMKAMKSHYPNMPRSMTSVVTLITGLIGSLAFLAVIFSA